MVKMWKMRLVESNEIETNEVKVGGPKMKKYKEF